MNLTEYFYDGSSFPPPLTPPPDGASGDSTSLKGFDDLTNILRENYHKKKLLERELVQIITFEEALANISSKPRMVQEPTLNLVTISEMNRYLVGR